MVLDFYNFDLNFSYNRHGLTIWRRRHAIMQKDAYMDMINVITLVSLSNQFIFLIFLYKYYLNFVLLAQSKYSGQNIAINGVSNKYPDVIPGIKGS